MEVWRSPGPSLCVFLVEVWAALRESLESQCQSPKPKIFNNLLNRNRKVLNES